MTGERTALLVQAGDHILAARAELYAAQYKLQSLSTLSPELTIAIKVILVGLQDKVDKLNCDYFITWIRDLAKVAESERI
jgi:hypothetical protein